MKRLLTERSDADGRMARRPLFGTGIVRIVGGALQVVKYASKDGVRRSRSGQSSVQLCPAVLWWIWMTTGRDTRESCFGGNAGRPWTDHHVICTLFIVHATGNLLLYPPSERSERRDIL